VKKQEPEPTYSNTTGISQAGQGSGADRVHNPGITISMSRKGNSWDNAACESFMKTLKYEEVFRNEYRDLAEAHRSIERFLEKVYNEKRLHSALGYRPPAEFESSLLGLSPRLTQTVKTLPAVR
jgi:putative transposase